ncbi:MAG: T9SS type A sorting domain-containing protein [Bacteroidia bacterium]|nr:T9SS type A sorting domain-containing protein [Bacteroidia bacterium]MCF8426854.1 T9SS type A sorting domain-containing protein [Bacteroidia bacterium]
MNRSIAAIFFIMLGFSAFSQQPGDTIKVQTFHYGSTTRDTFVSFPTGNLKFEKIIMKYNMRCKNALISNSTNRDQGCGEWDYSCNSYIVDSNKIEKVLTKQPKYIISNFKGNTFKYTTKPVYDYYKFIQQKIEVDSILIDSSFEINFGSASANQILKTDQRSGKTQLIYTAAELNAAGFTAGEISALNFQVSNNGGTAHFLKVKMKHSSLTELNPNNPETTGFTDVFFSDYTFVNGENFIRFKTPFNWNGTDNLVIELSYTNMVASTPIVFVGSTDTLNLSISSNNNFALNLSNFGNASLNTSNLSSIDKEITIAFWAYGDAAVMPVSTTLLYGYSTAAANRQLNIHLPHSNTNVYFDCGFSGGYDRINKVAVAAEQGGQWNHWAFTKNATTGDMKIYLNGVLWQSGTAKTKAIQILNLFLGTDQNLANNYKGKINQLSIWNKELSATTIANWMNLALNEKHPNYENLLNYYPLQEGSGLNLNEVKNNTVSTGTNLQWTYDRGEKLTSGFMASGIRPLLKLLRGDYNLTLTNEFVMDSVLRNTNTIEEFSVTSKEGIYPISNDLVTKISTTNNLFEANYSYVYEGNTTTLLDSIANASEGELVLMDFDKYNRFPFYNEIMSFVTPYGIGLDLGKTGKTWYYDVTDFTPILKGDKRIVMTLGGQNQEQMDVEFYFIVGTPVRDVLEFNQIWQGTNRIGSASIVSINNETKFAAENVPLLSTGKAFKIRSSITGHGSEGEFEVNGGPVDHMLNIGGGPTEFTWKIVMECGYNPVFPQGGTWVYDRQGWCPGKSSMLKEQYITPLVTPGATVSIDYNTSTPSVSGGAYNYQVAHQLVTYGDANFKTDARIMEVIEPSDKISYGRSNPTCSQPRIVVQNSGSDAITSMEISYWINNNSSKETFTWTGNLAFLDTTMIKLPIADLWKNGVLNSGNIFKAVISKVNGATDQYALNNLFLSPFERPEVKPGKLTVELRTNNNPTENSYQLVEESGYVIDAQTFDKANTTYSFTYQLGGCYKIIMKDNGNDGLSWWANSSQGTGFMRLRSESGSVLKTFQPDFGSGFEYGFTTDFLLSKNEVELSNIVILYPNPSRGNFEVSGEKMHLAEIRIFDIIGNEISLPNQVGQDKVSYSTNGLIPGVYLVQINLNNQKIVKRLLVN